MSPDYPPQTIVDSPWKEGEYLLVEEARLFTLGHAPRELTVPFLDHFFSSSLVFSPFPVFPPPFFLSFFFFFISWKGYRFEGIKGTRESKGPFVEIHLWLGLELERAILEDQEKAGVVSRRKPLSKASFSRLGFAMINGEFDIINIV